MVGLTCSFWTNEVIRKKERRRDRHVFVYAHASWVIYLVGARTCRNIQSHTRTLYAAIPTPLIMRAVRNCEREGWYTKVVENPRTFDA